MLMYRLYLLRFGHYKLKPEKLLTKCAQIAHYTQIESQNFFWTGQDVKFATNITMKSDKIVRKFAIVEGYNDGWVVYVKRYGRLLFEIRQPPGEKKCPYELHDESWTYVPYGFTFTTRPVRCPSQ